MTMAAPVFRHSAADMFQHLTSTRMVHQLTAVASKPLATLASFCRTILFLTSCEVLFTSKCFYMSQNQRRNKMIFLIPKLTTKMAAVTMTFATRGWMSHDATRTHNNASFKKRQPVLVRTKSENSKAT